MNTRLLLIVVAVVAVLLWLIPMDPVLRRILIGVCVVAFIVWVVNLLMSKGKD
jgi:hypothetical protein